MSEDDKKTATMLHVDWRAAQARATTTTQEAATAREDRLTTLEAAVRKLVDLVNAKLPPDSKMSDRDFISEVIGAVDNPDVFRALTMPIIRSV